MCGREINETKVRWFRAEEGCGEGKEVTDA